jgi:hypothetical protein
MKYLSFIIFIVSNLLYHCFLVLFTVVYRVIPGLTKKQVHDGLRVKNLDKNALLKYF